MNNSSSLSSPKESESGGSLTFKTLKKKIRNKFRLSRAEEGTKTIAQAVETLRRSNELLTEGVTETDDSEALKSEFKELKETLQSILNQNQILSEVVKTVDSACPDPFNEPEKFLVFFAQKTISSRSYSDDLFEDSVDGSVGGDAVIIAPHVLCVPEAQTENAFVRLQNLRMEEQKSFQMEKENYESRLAQLSLLNGEIEILRKQNSEHEIQLEFLRSQSEPVEEEVETLRNENGEWKRKYEELSDELNNLRIQDNEADEVNVHAEIAKLKTEIIELRDTHANELNLLKNAHANELIELKNSQANELNHIRISHSKDINELKAVHSNELQNFQVFPTDNSEEQLEGALQLERECQFRELSEENVRLKLEFSELEKELKAAKIQLNDFEKENISDIDLKNTQAVPTTNTSTNEDDSAFKYVYLSNLVLKFMQFPEKRAALSNIILTTLQSDQEYFQKAMSKQQKPQ